MAETDKDFILYIVKTIVENPNDVKVDRKIDERGVLLELSINPDDMGKIIGKEGRTAKALRTLLRVLGAKNNARVNLKIVEPEGSTRVKPEDKEDKEEKEEKGKKEKDKEEETATEVM